MCTFTVVLYACLIFVVVLHFSSRSNEFEAFDQLEKGFFAHLSKTVLLGLYSIAVECLLHWSDTKAVAQCSYSWRPV